MGDVEPEPAPFASGKQRNIQDTSFEVPLGSGAYMADDVKLGTSIRMKRVADYWGKDLPVNVGQNNFDTIRTDYYLDFGVALDDPFGEFCVAWGLWLIALAAGAWWTVFAPLLMTGLFAHFTGPAAPVYFPGAAFLAAAICELGALAIFVGAKARKAKKKAQKKR